MIGALGLLLVTICLVVPSHEQTTPLSPCPNVFMYEPSSMEPGRWYGVIKFSPDNTLHSLWLNIELDCKALILGNWVAEVTTTDNLNFKIENPKMTIPAKTVQEVRFFVLYDPLNKPPKIRTIRVNGREFCNANNPQPVVDRPDENETRPKRPVARPEESRPFISKIVGRPGEDIRPEGMPQTTALNGRPSDAGPVYVPTVSPTDQGNAKPFSMRRAPTASTCTPCAWMMMHGVKGSSNTALAMIAGRFDCQYTSGGGQIPSQNVDTQTDSRPSRPTYQATTMKPVRTTTNRRHATDDFDSDSRPNPEDYFERGPVVVVPSTGSSNNNFSSSTDNGESSQCGTVVMNFTPNPLVVYGKPTMEGQWPWQIALYQTLTVDSKYTCGGTLVTHRHVITAGHCVTLKSSGRVVHPSILTVFLGKHNLRTSVKGVQIKLVEEIIIHPQYKASNLSNDLAILKFWEPVTFTPWVRPACLWPENEMDLKNIVGKKGSVVGWGFDITGVPTEDLNLVEMPVVDMLTCVRSFPNFFTKYTSDFSYCAGNRDGSSVCNGDSGGGMVFNMNNRWYLRGLVSLSVVRHNEHRCDPTHFVIFTDVAKFLPWIKDTIGV